jgi:hypothetical protein
MIQDVDVLAGGPGANGRSMIVVFIPHSFWLTTWSQSYKTFTAVIYGFLWLARVFVPGKPSSLV